MSYIAVTQGTADWLLGKTGLLDSIHESINTEAFELSSLNESEFVEGPIRITSSDHRLLAIWNIDYLSGTGEESWGFIKRDGNMGILSEPSISREVFERCLYIINQRLQGLKIDGAYIHRSYSNQTHTCLAGRGSTARHFSVGYYERIIEEHDSPHQAVICVGPAQDFSSLSHAAATEGKQLDSLAKLANSLSSPGRKRIVAGESVLGDLRRFLLPYTKAEPVNEYREVEIITERADVFAEAYRTMGLAYDDWIEPDSPLSDVQRRILASDAITHHPLRITGPGGSGKTLLMQLLALRQLRNRREEDEPIRILYITHNAAMANSVGQRFELLEGQHGDLWRGKQLLDIYTLSEYGRQQLDLDFQSVIDADAFEAKQFQLAEVSKALSAAMEDMQGEVSESKLFSEVRSEPELFPVLARLIMAEISTAIKGHGLESDKKRYVQSERSLSRLHGVLTEVEREIVYSVFERYNKVVFEEFEVLDTDDIALSLLGRLRTPIWELKRRQLGYDFVFVDETQLFNENERRILPLLTNGNQHHVPIVLALDEAQDVYNQSRAGLSTLGIPNIASENLASIHRSTRAIVRLAFFIIQRSTDLFGPDFPDFTGIAEHMEPDTHPLAMLPSIEEMGQESRSLGRFVLKQIRELRKSNLRQIAVICHTDLYWEGIEKELRATDLPLQVLLKRGQKLPASEPLVVLTRPLYAGGQEFDAVILIGLEQGVVPPRIADNDALSVAIEQQTLREMYLSVTRARYRVIVALSSGASPTGILQEAEKAGVLTRKH